MPRTVAGGGFERTDVAKNGSGTLPLTGSSQTFVNSNNARVGLFVSNTSGANKMFVALGPTAVANQGIMIPPNTTIPIPGYSGAVSVIGTAADVLAYAEI